MLEIFSATFSAATREWLFFIALIVLLGFLSIVIAAVRRRKLAKSRVSADTPFKQSENWHEINVDRVFAILHTNTSGLSPEQASLRHREYGPNCLPEAKTQSSLMRFFAQFHNILIYVLLGTSVVTAILEHWVDTSVIFGVVIINAMIGFIQEGKAENALRAIRQMLSSEAMVLRDGRRITLAASEVVPGDIVLLQSGDKVPADLRLFYNKGLQIQESVLTGESVAVTKTIEPVGINTVLGDRSNMAYSGTLVTRGQGSGIVVAIGENTEIGLISTLVATVEALSTPMLRQMTRFGRWLTAAILVIAGMTFSFGVLVRGYAATDMFLAAVGLAVAAIPEGLPAIMTITLAIGVQRMARRKAIIRRLPAVETLGAVTVICSDKTGTLTRNEMTVRTVATAENRFEVSGIGYDTHGAFLQNGIEVTAEDYPVLIETIRAGVLCNDTTIELQDEGDWVVHGDPMEGALLITAFKAALDTGYESRMYPRTDLIPFESEHRFMATLHHSHSGEAFIFLKGAPEKTLERCKWQRTRDGDVPLDISSWQVLTEELALQGQRVLAIAVKPARSHKLEVDFADVRNDLVLLGLFGFIDPPRNEAIEAVRQCQEAGIRVKMITGDHGTTAGAIARQLNLLNPEKVLLGRDLDSMTEEDLRRMVLDVDVFARVSPGHKLLLVRLLQEQGLIVAMTGDGVNDAPALKRADVGTAMGHKGTEVAKEAAEMVLADNNFASIVHAVEEGRTVYDNLKKAILFILPSSGGEALIIIVAILFGYHQLPLTPVQILWVNMITTVTLALVLAFEPPEMKVMHRPPRSPKEPLLSLLLVWRIVFVSIILMSGTFGLFLWEMDQGMSIEHARTVAVNTLVMFEIFYLFNSRYIIAPVLNLRGLFGNRYILLAIGVLIVFQFCFTYLFFMQSLFGTTDIDPSVWGRIILVASSVLFLVELEKAVIRLGMRRK